jgi:hypothetical protein
MIYNATAKWCFTVSENCDVPSVDAAAQCWSSLRVAIAYLTDIILMLVCGKQMIKQSIQISNMRPKYLIFSSSPNLHLHLNTNMDAPIRRLPQRAKKQEAHFS